MYSEKTLMVNLVAWVCERRQEERLPSSNNRWSWSFMRHFNWESSFWTIEIYYKKNFEYSLSVFLSKSISNDFFCKFYEAYFAFFIISFSITRKSWLDRLVDWECFKEAIHHFIQEMTSTKRSKNDIETKRFFLVNWNINVFLIYKKILVFAILKKRYLSYPYVFIFTAYSWLNVIYLWSKYR